jgi:metal-sulfur cluster biosynthetic enzyme
MSDTAPPPSPEPSTPFAPAAEGPYAQREQLITENLKQIFDPEIPMNIVDLGLIYGFEWTNDSVKLKMTLTAVGCPVAGILAEEVKLAIEKVPNVKSATVELIWDPPWSPERMSDFAKRQFGYV